MKIEKLAPELVSTEKEEFIPRKKGFSALNWLRFLLAVYIVLFHTLKNYASLDHTWSEAVLGLGNMATSVFFVLSGFLLTYAYVVQKNGRPVDRRNFMIARFSNLYPLHIAGLLLSLLPIAIVIASKGGVSVPMEVSGTAKRMLSHGELLAGLIMNILLLNAWNPFYMSFNYPSWSLSALGCYYLLFPAIAPKIYRMKNTLLALVALGMVFSIPGLVADLLGLTDVVTDGLLHRNPIVRFPLFLAGMVLCVHFSHSKALGGTRQIVVMGGIVLATVIAGVWLQHEENRMHLIKNGMYYPAALATIWLCVCMRPTHNASIRHWGERLGAASLPIFLLHGPTFQLFQPFEQLVMGALHSPDWRISSIIAAGRDVERSVGFFLVYLVGLILLCIFVQERLVAPLQVKIRNRWGTRKPAPAVTGDSRNGTN